MGWQAPRQFIQKCEYHPAFQPVVVGALLRRVGVVDVEFYMGDLVVAGVCMIACLCLLAYLPATSACYGECSRSKRGGIYY